jgi:hypothetical protein
VLGRDGAAAECDGAAVLMEHGAEPRAGQSQLTTKGRLKSGSCSAGPSVRAVLRAQNMASASGCWGYAGHESPAYLGGRARGTEQWKQSFCAVNWTAIFIAIQLNIKEYKK